MNRLLGFIILLFFSSASIAQNRPLQNVRRNIVTSRYECIDGKKGTKYRAVHQEILDSLSRAHTILEWDFETGDVYNYVWHIFTGNQITTTCTFRDKMLRTIQNFSYGPDSLLQIETIMKVTPGDTAHYATLYYSYAGKNPVQVEAKNFKGQRICRTKSTFDHNGTELTRRVKAKSGYIPLDSISNLTCIPTYDSIGRKVSETRTTKFFGGKQTTKYFTYGYDDKNLLTSFAEINAVGKQMYRVANEYNSKGKLKFISRYNADDVLVDYCAIRYELYPTRDRRNRIIEY